MPLPRSLTCSSCQHTYPEGWIRCPYCGFDPEKQKRDRQVERALIKRFPSYAAAVKADGGGGQKRKPGRRDRKSADRPARGGDQHRPPAAESAESPESAARRSRRRRGRRRRGGSGATGAATASEAQGTPQQQPNRPRPPRGERGPGPDDKAQGAQPPRNHQAQGSDATAGGDGEARRARRRRPRRRRRPQGGGDGAPQKSDS